MKFIKSKLISSVYSFFFIFERFRVFETSYICRKNLNDITGGLIKTSSLLMVATGYKQDALVYVQIDDRMRIIDGYSVNIY